MSHALWKALGNFDKHPHFRSDHVPANVGCRVIGKWNEAIQEFRNTSAPAVELIMTTDERPAN